MNSWKNLRRLFMISKKQQYYYFGIIAEIIASFYLRLKFYQIIAHRLKTPFGEIDLIAKKGNTIIFLEIKARNDTSLMDFISKYQQQRIIKAAQYFILTTSRYQKFSLRFDAIIINKYLWPKHFLNYW